jgi:hypothetical protein
MGKFSKNIKPDFYVNSTLALGGYTGAEFCEVLSRAYSQNNFSLGSQGLHYSYIFKATLRAPRRTSF